MIVYVLGAAGAGVVGGIVAFFWTPRVWARRAIQHFAAGIVIAAVASDLIPHVIEFGTPAGVLGQQLGALLAVALAIELFFLTLSVGAEYHKTRSGICPVWR